PQSLFVRDFPIFRCNSCKSLCRVDAAEELAQQEPWPKRVLYLLRPPVVVTFDDCMEALAGELVSSHDEARRLRLFAFQVSNDIHRDAADSVKIRPEDRSQAWGTNLLKLIPLCSHDNPGEVAAIIDAYRELGDYSLATSFIELGRERFDDFHR